MTASFINGTAGTVLEMDEGSQFARGHPGMHVFPALLAAAQIQPISEKEFLTAFIVGYEHRSTYWYWHVTEPTYAPPWNVGRSWRCGCAR